MDEKNQGTYSFGETADIGQEYVDAYNSGVGFTMDDPVIIVDTGPVVNPGSWSRFPGLKIGLGIGGGVLLIGGIILAIVLLRRK